MLKRLWKTPGSGQLTTSADRRLWLRGIVGRGCLKQLLPFDRQREDEKLRTYSANLHVGLGNGEVIRTTLRGQCVVEVKTLNGVTFPIFNGGQTSYDNCPNVVVRDSNRLWSTLNGALLGVSLTTPVFSDGGVDYVPYKNCPSYALCLPNSLNATCNVRDKDGHNFSGFNYEARTFKELDREYDQDCQISTDQTCYEHHASRRYVYSTTRHRRLERGLIVPRSDPLKPVCSQDDLLAKVPRSNIALQGRLKSCNSLRCLTMFEDNSNGARYVHTYPARALMGYKEILRDNRYGCRNLDGFIRACEKRNRRQLVARHSIIPSTRLMEHVRNLLYHAEFVFIKGVCMVYDGLNCPGRSKKSSGLLREFSTFTSNHLLVGKGLVPKIHKDRALSYGESKQLTRCLEHDRMLYSNYGRQFSTFCLDDQVMDYDSQRGGLIDEVVFARQKRHKQSTLVDWKLSISKDDNILVGGLQSSCYNACNKTKDYMGRMIHSFQAVFTSEKESEMFYVEMMLRRLTLGSVHVDCFKRVRITRFLSVCRDLLEDFGSERDHPRSAVSVDEDFHYMRGRCGANDNKDSSRYQAWPTNSVFNYRSEASQVVLNDTLSLTVVAKSKIDKTPLIAAVRCLKRTLFEDGFNYRVKFHEVAQRKNSHNDFCCECTYASCQHYEEIREASTLDYLRLTCAYCTMRIEKTCDRGSACCIRKMESNEWCNTITDASTFVKKCRHFEFERAFIYFVMEGNPFENAHRHMERYFEYIDKRQDLTTQRLKLAGKLSVVKEGSFVDGLMFNVCKSSDNGTRCWACERQSKDSIGVQYVEIRPKINEGNSRKQIAKRVNVCAINNLKYRKLCLADVPNQWVYRQQLRNQTGMCTINCNQRHNLHSGLATLTVRFRTKFNDVGHWPRQNYEADHVSGVSGDKCGCGREWSDDGRVHSLGLLSKCLWTRRTGDVISMTYDRDIYEGINPVTSFGEFAVHHACRCLPSMTLLKHCPSTERLRRGGGTNEHDKDCCSWKSVSCGENCSSCVHYCSCNFTC